MGTEVILMKTNHGIDGWDAKTEPVAVFYSEAAAMTYLKTLGYDFPQWGSFYARNINHRNCMGAISYQIQPAPTPLPVVTPPVVCKNCHRPKDEHMATGDIQSVCPTSVYAESDEAEEQEEREAYGDKPIVYQTRYTTVARPKGMTLKDFNSDQ